MYIYIHMHVHMPKVTMKTPSILRNLSSRLSATLSPSPVAPWPRVRTAFDQWLDDLRAQPSAPCSTSAIWLSKALDIAIAAQRSTARSVRSSSSCPNQMIRGKDLDVTIELLDACDDARRRVGSVRAYIDSLAIALHCLEGAPEPSRAALRRARAELESCAATEKRRGSTRLGKLGERRLLAEPDHLHEALRGSQSVALLAVSAVEMACSFRRRKGALGAVAALEGFGCDTDGGVAMEELAATVAAAGRLRGLMAAREINVESTRGVAGELRRRCGELEERLSPLERRVGVLYRELIDVRMSLLGMISGA